MARIGFVADVHIGNHKFGGGLVEAGQNKRAELCLGVLKRTLELAARKDVTQFVVLGDLFDNTRPYPQTIRRVQEIFASHGFYKILLVGNHDRNSGVVGDHALGPLAPYARIVANPEQLCFGKQSAALIPFQPGSTKDWLSSVLDSVPSSNVLCAHFGIFRDSDATSNFWMGSVDDAICTSVAAPILQKAGITDVFLGNWHNPLNVVNAGVKFWQVGALIPTGFDNPGPNYGQLLILDTDKNCAESYVVPGPRFFKCASLTELKELEEDIAGTAAFPTNYVRVAVSPAELADVSAYVKNCAWITEAQVLTESTDYSSALKKNVTQTRSNLSLPNAVADIVVSHPPPQHLDAARSKQLLYKFLGLSGANQ